MALDVNATKIDDLFDPQVIGDMLNTKLYNAIKFTPLAIVNRDLQGRPGSTVLLPYYSAIGSAEVVAEGADVPIKKLTEQTKDVTIKKLGIGVQLTDEAVLYAYGDTIGEATTQMAQAIADKIDNDFIDILEANDVNVYEVTGASVTADDIADALVDFGEDIDGSKVMLVDPETYAVFRKADDWIPASDIAADTLIKGVVGMIHGCQVVVTNRLKEKNLAFIVKPGAVAIYIKRDTLIETDRDIVNKSTVLTADKYVAEYLQDATKAITIQLPGYEAPSDDDSDDDSGQE